MSWPPPVAPSWPSWGCVRDADHAPRRLACAPGLPPEKWPSLRYGFAPCGGYFHGTEEAYG